MLFFCSPLSTFARLQNSPRPVRLKGGSRGRRQHLIHTDTGSTVSLFDIVSDDVWRAYFVERWLDAVRCHRDVVRNVAATNDLASSVHALEMTYFYERYFWPFRVQRLFPT